MKKITALYIILLLITSCSNSETKEIKKDTTVAEAIQADVITMPEVEGVYKGKLPCADCAGTMITIQLSNDSTYIVEQEYLGKKKDDVFYNLGKWNLRDSIVTLNGITDAPQKYKATLNTITQLDAEGKEITGTSLNFTLTRIANKTFKTKMNIPVEGMFTYYADAHLFKVCATGKQYPAELTKETLKMETDYSSLKKKDAEPLLAHVEGVFEMHPAIEGDKQQETFVIKKFIKFLPGEKCKN